MDDSMFYKFRGNPAEEPLVFVASQKFSEGKLIEALSIYKHVIATDPDNANAYLGAGIAETYILVHAMYFSSYSQSSLLVNESISLLQKGVDLDPESLSMLRALAEAYTQQAHLEFIYEHLLLATKAFDLAEKTLNTLKLRYAEEYLNKPLPASILLLEVKLFEEKANIFTAKGLYDDAISLLYQLLEISTELDATSPEVVLSRGRVWYGIGKALRGKLSFKEAKYPLLESLKVHKAYLNMPSSLPSEILVVFSQASVLHNIGSLYLSLAEATTALSQDKEYPELLREATKYFTKAIALSPHPAYSSYSSRGSAYEKLGKLPAAIADFKQAISLTPDNNKIRLKLAQLLRDHGEIADSLFHYLEAVKITPLDRELWTEIAYTVKEHEDNLNIKENVLKQLEAIKADLEGMGDDEPRKNIPPNPTESDFYFLLRAEISDQFALQRSIALGLTPPPETLYHRLGGIVSLVLPNLLGGGPLVGMAADATVGKIVKKLVQPVNQWNRQKSQLIARVFAEDDPEAENGIFDELCELIAQTYGPAIENLGVNSVGLLALVNTIVERLFISLGNDPQLIRQLESGQISIVDAMLRKVASGQADYPVMTNNLTYLDASAIIAGIVS